MGNSSVKAVKYSNFLTGMKDVDLLILSKLDYQTLLSLHFVNKYVYKLLSNESFWKNKLDSLLCIFPFLCDINKLRGNISNKDLYFIFSVYTKLIIVENGKIVAPKGPVIVKPGIIVGTHSFNITQATEMAIAKNYVNVVKYFISEGFWESNVGLMAAAKAGHRNLVNFFISRGANYWNNAMVEAAKSGHRELVYFFVDKGAHCWDEGLEVAVKCEDKELIHFFLSKDRSYYSYAVQLAKENGKQEIVKYLKKQRNNLFPKTL
jgi:hypothetical protein